MLRYLKSPACWLAFFAAVLWSGAIALLIGQVHDVILRPFAITTVIVAATMSVVFYLDRVAARLASCDTRPPIVVHADWTPDLALRTTLRSTPTYRGAVSIPMPVLSCSGRDGDTTLSLRRHVGTATMDVIPSTGDPAYDKAFTAISNGLIEAREDDPWFG